MPRTLKPERYPMEFFEITLRAWRSHAPLEIPCESSSRAAGLRTKFYYFFRALDSRSDDGAGPLARRLVAGQRLPPAFDSDPGWELRAASDLLAAVADTGLDIQGSSLWLVPKSQSPYALVLRSTLDALSGGSAAASLDRLQELLRTPPTTEGEEK